MELVACHLFGTWNFELVYFFFNFCTRFVDVITVCKVYWAESSESKVKPAVAF